MGFPVICQAPNQNEELEYIYRNIEVFIKSFFIGNDVKVMLLLCVKRSIACFIFIRCFVAMSQMCCNSGRGIDCFK